MIMKAVTRDRILQALDHVDRFREAITGSDGDVIQAMVLLGMQSRAYAATGYETPRHVLDRTGLELDFLGVPKSPEELLKIQARFWVNINRCNRFQEKIFALQAQHGISGLERGTYELGGQEFPCWDECDGLRLIEADLPILRSEKPAIANHWMEYVIANGLDIYQQDDDLAEGWYLVDADVVLAAIPFYDWAMIWDNSDCDELHLTLGNGTNRIFRDIPSVKFCASPEWPLR
jgi:hypothetical protein